MEQQIQEPKVGDDQEDLLDFFKELPLFFGDQEVVCVLMETNQLE